MLVEFVKIVFVVFFLAIFGTICAAPFFLPKDKKIIPESCPHCGATPYIREAESYRAVCARCKQ